MNRASSTVDGPWTISPDVAWLDGEQILVLDLRAPYDRLPWRLNDTAALVWECVAAGMDRAQIAAELQAPSEPAAAAAIDTFLEELTDRGLIVAGSPTPAAQERQR